MHGVFTELATDRFSLKPQVWHYCDATFLWAALNPFLMLKILPPLWIYDRQHTNTGFAEKSFRY